MRLEAKTKREASPSGPAGDLAERVGRVLIVDDEPNVRLVFRTALESDSCLVDEAVGGEEALECLRSGLYDMVLLDLSMPGVGGMEVLRRLRDDGNNIPVVIITAHGSVPDAVEAMKLGTIDFLSKPITPDVLRRVVSEVIERHTSADAEKAAEPPARSTPITLAPTVINLAAVKLALNRRDFDRASALLKDVLDIVPDSAEVLTLMGVLHECWGQDHAAYHSYKKALTASPHYEPALDNLRRYCERFGLDFESPRINPTARL